MAAKPLTPEVAAALQQSSHDQGIIVAGGTILTQSSLGVGITALRQPVAYGSVYVDTGGGAVTGIILQPGLYSNQPLYLVNYSIGIGSIAFATLPAGNVLGGPNTSIVHSSAQLLIWVVLPKSQLVTNGVWVQVI